MNTSEPQKERPTYWFRAKRYGWGWDMPLTWQGWVVYGIFIASLIGAAFLFPFDTEEDVTAYVRTAIGLAILLISITWWKGEPARWRWGKRKEKVRNNPKARQVVLGHVKNTE